ncbi:MAG: glycosyltransferase family 2 protein [Deltaproteobacteria bacterium]|nr:glycosyltransferase family 2 protein [Deltaproteobacteria bacterium]
MTSPHGTAEEIARGAPGREHRVSVALCTYNGARYVEEQLDSFMAQTRRPDELVVCDDISTDGTLTILAQFARRATFPVRIERNGSRLGSTKNFEKAIGLCTGDLIATSDQDDVWLPEKLALCEAEFDALPECGLVFTNAEVVDESLVPVGHQLWDAIHFGLRARWRARRGRVFEILLRQWLVTGATMVFRAEYRPVVLPIPDNWIHDGWIAFIIGALAPIGCVERSTVKYRQHAAQQIGGKKLSLRELYELARKVGPDYFRLAHERYCLAQERLRALAPRLRNPEFLAMVERKVAHQRRRLAIAESSSRLDKVTLTLAELLHGGYHRYSPSTTHFLKDLLF